MPFCSNCGQEIERQVKFCPGGGKPLAVSEEPEGTEAEGAEPESEEETKGEEAPAEELEKILQDIEGDFDSTLQDISDNLETVYASVGESYQDYRENKQLISDWYAQALEGSNQLFERTMEHSVQYFRAVAAAAGDDSAEADDLMEIPRAAARRKPSPPRRDRVRRGRQKISVSRR